MLQRALAIGQLPARAAEAFTFPPHAPADTPALLGVADHTCVFRASCRCQIHTELGHAALPLACRQFPRICVIDPRGVSVTLSHYCPTARELLADATTPLTIVTNAPAFPADAEYSGLDVRASLPPLLRPEVLMDWESWWRWEALSVDLIANASSPARALRQLDCAVEATRAWSPLDGPLLDLMEQAFHTARGIPTANAALSVDEISTRCAEVLRAIPDAFEAPPPSREPLVPAIAARLLAAHAFGNWTAHLGHGLRTWLRSLEAVDALLQSGFDSGQVDLLIRHLADPAALAKIWHGAELVS